MQLINGRKDYQDESRKETERLEGVGEHQCADAASSCIEPDEQYHHHHIHRKGDTGGGEDELLEDDADDVESDGGTRHLR